MYENDLGCNKNDRYRYFWRFVRNENKLSQIKQVRNIQDNIFELLSEVENETLLRFIGTSKLTQGQLSATITDGRITGVTIVTAGRGYIDPAFNSTTDTKRRGPSVSIQGTGTGAEIETYINNLGQIIEATIVNEGKNYSQIL